jgi:hypothetical protein
MQIINNYNIVYDVFYKNENATCCDLFLFVIYATCSMLRVCVCVCVCVFVLCIHCNYEENIFFSPPPNC